jgi:hypothetical protein
VGLNCNCHHGISEHITRLEGYDKKIAKIVLLVVSPYKPAIEGAKTQILSSLEDEFKKQHLPLAVYPVSGVSITSSTLQKFSDGPIKFLSAPDYEQWSKDDGEKNYPTHIMYLTVLEATWTDFRGHYHAESVTADDITGLSYRIRVVDVPTQKTVYQY